LLHTIIITTFENKKVGGLQTFKLCEKQEKSTKDWKVKPPPPHIFQMVKDYGGFFTPLDLEHLKMGG
jgi:hypothetical protein